MTSHQSTPSAPVRPRQRELGVLLALTLPWLLPGAIATVQAHIGSPLVGPQISWPQALAWQMPAWTQWAIWTLLVRQLVLALPMERIGAVSWFGVHLLTCAVVAGTDLVVVAVLDRTFLPGYESASFASVYQSELINHLDFSVILYWTTLGTIYMVEFHRRARQRELDAAELRTRLVAAELEALRMQLNPHFLFNALQAASELMHTDPTSASRMLNRISALLRQALRGGASAEIPLWQELELADAYLQIARLRFGRELEVITDVEADAVDVLVPGLVLQPLLENCFQHGFVGRVVSPRLTLSARVVGDRLLLSVADNGGRTARARPQGFGIGLRNTEARLKALYGDRATLRTEVPREGGYRVDIEMPALVRAETAAGAPPLQPAASSSSGGVATR
jgi:hypothetical protein